MTFSPLWILVWIGLGLAMVVGPTILLQITGLIMVALLVWWVLSKIG